MREIRFSAQSCGILGRDFMQNVSSTHCSILPFTETVLDHAVAILRSGGVVILPTDTVYGLVCHPDFPEAVERIRRMKRRDRDKPFQKLAASVAAIWADGAVKSKQAEQYAAFWPGALTLVLETKTGRVEGYRVPDAPLLCRLLERSGGMLCATSVNISGEPPANAVNSIPVSILNAVDLVLDGGAILKAEASSVVRIFADDTVKLLRPGKLFH